MAGAAAPATTLGTTDLDAQDTQRLETDGFFLQQSQCVGSGLSCQTVAVINNLTTNHTPVTLESRYDVALCQGLPRPGRAHAPGSSSSSK